jgi:hypothetical protein
MASKVRIIEALTFELTFFKGEEVKPTVFTINVARDEYDDPKEAAIDHITKVWDNLKAGGFDGWLPKFKTFRVLNSRVLDDLAWR